MKLLLNLNQSIRQIANFRLLLLLTVLLFGLGLLVVSPFSPSAELMALADGRDVPDTQFNRSAEDLYRQLSAYGDYGRHLYLTRISPVDLFIPLAQALFLAVAISLVFQRAFSPASRWQMINLLPFVAMLGDYLENVSMICLMLAYPTRWELLANVSGWFTAVKFIFSIASVGCIAAGSVIWLMKRGLIRQVKI